MAKQFLTSLDLNKNELLNAKIHSLTSAPSSPVAGQIYYNTTEQTLNYYNGSAWQALAIGGSVTDAISNAIDALTTDDIEEGSNNLYYTDARVQAVISNSTSDDVSEGSTNLYFTDERAQDAIGNAITGGTQTNITVTYDDENGTYSFVAENGVADSSTDDLSEGSTNLYFTQARARGSVSGDSQYISYNSATGQFSLDTANAATVAYVDQEITDVTNIINAISTTDVAEGTNLYYTDARARNAIAAGDNTLSYDAGTGVLTANTSTLALKSYVDSQVQASAQGLDVKLSVRVATTENINLTSVTEIDGVTLADGDRVLVKDQTTQSENGLYVHSGGALTRAADADTDSEVTAGVFTFVEEGTQYADTGWVISSNNPLSVGTDAIVWTQFSGAGVISAGAGLVQNGTTFDVVGTTDRITVNADSIDIASTYVGQTSITTLGTITTGTWTANTIGVEYGGTGTTSLAAGEYVKGNGTGALTTSATIPVSDLSGTLAISQGGTGATTAAGARSNLGATTKYAESNTEITPAGNTATWTVSHSMNTSDVQVQVRDLATNEEVVMDVTITDANTVTLQWYASSTVSADSYRVVVIG